MKRRYLVSGMVQGVGFRHFTWRHARRLGLRGWVSNLPDGRVEAVAEGAPAELSAFEAELRSGPSAAMVTNLLVTEFPDDVETPKTFDIK